MTDVQPLILAHSLVQARADLEQRHARQADRRRA